MKQDISDIIRDIDPRRIPRHVAVIMDGNGRWARQRGLDRSMGHSEGVASVHKATAFASDLGIEYLTLYAFSTENWKRPEAEVSALMYLIGWAIERELPELIANNVRISLVGDIERIPDESRRKLLDAVERTAGCTGLNLRMCLSYSARWEISRAAFELAADAAAGRLAMPEDSSRHEDIFERYINPDGIPDPDLLIRTGGEERISNFLLWQIAYSELYFTPVLWPDFDQKAFADAIVDFQRRERRFGMTSDQVADE